MRGTVYADDFLLNPTQSTRKRARTLNLSHPSLARILHYGLTYGLYIFYIMNLMMDLSFHQNEIQIVQELKTHDYIN